MNLEKSFNYSQLFAPDSQKSLIENLRNTMFDININDDFRYNKELDTIYVNTPGHTEETIKVEFLNGKLQISAMAEIDDIPNVKAEISLPRNKKAKYAKVKNGILEIQLKDSEELEKIPFM